MVRLSPGCWLKTSVEYESDGPSRLGAVVTNGAYSDWSTQEFPAERGEIWLRIRREATDYIVDTSADGGAWTQIRMAHLHDDRPEAPVAAGLYACSPKASGFVAEFSFLRIESRTP
jgi:regulation of enolase protein 1 (concanavalin A-like superfamily)